jgi:hypothetical protein
MEANSFLYRTINAPHWRIGFLCQLLCYQPPALPCWVGVPVEFIGREARRRDPVASMRGYGTHHQPPDMWSDNASLTFYLAETLASRPDVKDSAARLVA